MSVQGGQQLYFTPATPGQAYAELAERCRQQGHLALGLATAAGVVLNLGGETRIGDGMQVVTIGPTRLGAV